MFKTLSTLISGVSSRTEDRVRDAFAIELIDQKIRESDTALKAGKATLASLIQRQRSEHSQRKTLQGRIDEMTTRAKAALEKGNDDMATQAAQAIATMENELALRQKTCERLDQKVLRLRDSIEASHRRIIDLKQGAVQARAVRREQDIQMKLRGTTTGSATEEAEELIARVLGDDDPFEQSEIMDEINKDLDHSSLTDRMADAGFGDVNRTTAQSVLARLKAEK